MSTPEIAATQPLGNRYEDWDVADRAGQPIEAVRAIRDHIQARVTALLAEILT